MSHLPIELRIPIGQWDVSRVTNFESLFDGYDEFNEDLSGWNVENAENMDYMFAGCTFLDQSFATWKPRRLTTCAGMFRGCTYFTGEGLNEWGPYLTRVEYMSEMFKDCTRLDTPLDRWQTSSVTHMNEMFKGCERFNSNLRGWNVANVEDFSDAFDYGFDPMKRPRFGMPTQEELNAPPPVNVAREIHAAVAKVNLEVLVPYLKARVGKSRPVIVDYRGLVYRTMSSFVEQIQETKDIKHQQMTDLERIMKERLDDLDFTLFSPDLMDALYYAIEFVKQQRIEFKTIYVANFITDCVQAYVAEDPKNQMSCSQGVLERTFMTLGATCERISVLMPETDYMGDQNKTYTDLAKMITATPMFRIPDLILDWYKAHKNGKDLPTVLTNSLPLEVRKNVVQKIPQLESDKVRHYLRRRHLKEMLLQEYPKEGDLIEKLVSNYANTIGYNDDDFGY